MQAPGGTIESRRLGTDAAIVQAVRALSPRRVLDVGCGEGWLVHALASEGVDALGVDASAPLLEAAREGPGRFLLVRYDEIARESERLGGPFDAIVCSFSLLGEDLLPLLIALRGRLEQDGRLFIQTLHPLNAGADVPYCDGWHLESFDAFGKAFPEPMPWYFRTVGSWWRLLAAAGYRVANLDEPQPEGASRPLSLLWEAAR
jgi:2-polyprenyl-3-methyl-5-hydroxy-6-metoxy-1,4-benzoquinol methylase